MSLSKPASNAPVAFLALGSNLGDRRSHLAQAVEQLRAAPGVSVTAVSPVYATEAVGMPGEPGFLNAALEIRTELTPEDLLATCLEIERRLGRVRPQRSRTIDIDLLLFEDRRLSAARLTVPHPRMKERAFVLVPLAAIAPGRVLDGRTIAEWASGVDASGVRRLEEGGLGPAPVRGIPPAGPQ